MIFCVVCTTFMTDCAYNKMCLWLQRDYDEQTRKRLNQALLLCTKLKIPREQDIVSENLLFVNLFVLSQNHTKTGNENYKYLTSSNPCGILASSKTIAQQGTLKYTYIGKTKMCSITQPQPFGKFLLDLVKNNVLFLIT